MRVVFAGTPEFSVPSLAALAKSSEVELVAIYTQPDRPAGRGKKLLASPVKKLGVQLGLPIHQPYSFKSNDAVNCLEKMDVDLMVVVAYGLILPQAILDVPRLGCINVHASLLPRWRGAAPIQRAIEAGDQTTGITLMQMAAGLDNGPILAQSKIAISDNETGGSLHDRLSALGATVLIDNLSAIMRRSLQLKDQDESKTTYAVKLSKAEGALDWTLPTRMLERKIRAYYPWPIAIARINGQVVRLLKASYRDGEGDDAPGTIRHADKTGILVQTGKGQINLEVLQKPGGKAMPVAEFLNGNPLRSGMGFESIT